MIDRILTSTAARNVTIRFLTAAHDLTDGVNAGLGWGLALMGVPAVDRPRLDTSTLRREGNVIYLPAARRKVAAR